MAKTVLAPNTPSFSEQIEKVRIDLGSGGFGFTYDLKKLCQEATPVLSYGDNHLVTLLIKDNQMFVNSKILGEGQAQVEVTNNEFVVRPLDWDRNFSDNFLEVVDAKGQPRFQMIRKRPNHIVVNGIFTNSKVVIMATDNGFMMNPSEENMANAMATLKPIFKYPSSKFRGQFVTDAS